MKCPKCKTENADNARFCSQCAIALVAPEESKASLTKTLKSPAHEPFIGSIFAGRYEIIEELGKGGMGSVYVALDQEINIRIALKLIKPEIAADQDTIKRFRNELKVAREITHKNVCRMYDLNKSDESYFITMEYVEGQDLKSLIKQTGRLAVPTAISIAKQVCSGLSEAHALGVTHRDLKPANIMVDKQGNARIMDFGIARLIEDDEITQAGAIIGTPAYMSPEQAEGKEVDNLSDLYSLGVILNEMVTGEVQKDPQKLKKDIPAAFQRIIHKCIQEEKQNSYQNVDDLLSELNKIDEVKAAPIDKAEWQNSIAVLPFADLSPKRDQEYFCDGLSETLINVLTQIEDLRVVARTSAFSFKGKDQDIREIGEKLSVKLVLEGSLQKAGNRLRISAQLINVEDGYHLWSQQYNVEFDDIFAIQDEISLKIVEQLKIKLKLKEQEKLTKRYTEDIEAYNLYLKGRFHWDKLSEKGFRFGIKYFKQAIKKDPTYALAYAGMADCHTRLGWYYFGEPRVEFQLAQAAAEKALTMDDQLAEAHCSMGWFRMCFDWDWKEAEREFNLATRLNPGYAYAHSSFSVLLAVIGRVDEAIAEAKKALDLDPFHGFTIANLGLRFYYAGQFDMAIHQIQQVLDMDPNSILGYLYISFPLAMAGRYQEAIQKIQRAIELSGEESPLFLATLGFMQALYGNINKAEEILKKLVELPKEKYISPFWVAWIFIGLGQKDSAFEWLEKAYIERDPMLMWIKLDPLIIEGLHSDPRIHMLLNKMNLE